MKNRTVIYSMRCLDCKWAAHWVLKKNAKRASKNHRCLYDHVIEVYKITEEWSYAEGAHS